jgi:hypothetical protein
MESVRAVGIRTNDPQRVEVALFALKHLFGMPEKSDGYGVATFIDDSVLLTRVPGVSHGKCLADLATSLKGASALMQIREQGELRPHSYQAADANLGPFRLHNFAASIVGGPQNADEASACREELLAGLPEFMRGSVSGQTEAEALFLNIVAECYKYSGLDQRYPDPQKVVDAVRLVEAKIKSKHPRSVLFATGREVIHVSHQVPSVGLLVEGLSFEMAENRSAAFIDSATARERLRQFRGAFSFAGLKKPFKSDVLLPAGVTIKSFAEGTCYVLGKDASIRMLS